MSDLYLELRSRIPVVAAKTHVGTARIEEAQARVGLSNEAIARRIPVSEKTWRRWKQAGEIPTAFLPTVAAVLRLELREIVPDDQFIPSVGAGVEEARDLRILVDALLRSNGLDPEEILRDARLRSEEHEPGAADRGAPGEAA